MLRRANAEHRVSNDKIYVDTRSIFAYVYEQTATFYGTFLFTLLAVTMLILKPASFVLTIPLIYGVCLLCYTNKFERVLPLKLPIFAKMLDRKNFAPGQRTKFKEASGTIMLGNEMTTKKECWLMGADLLTHMLLIGTTGAGKTVTLMSMMSASSFLLGGGCIYVDAKAAPDLLFRLVAVARMFGREDQVKLISFKTGGVAVPRRSWKRLSNTTQPFSQGPATTVSQILKDGLPDSSGDNQIFQDYAITILDAVMPCLTELRDKNILNITPSTIADFIDPKKVLMLAYPEHYNHKVVFNNWTLGRCEVENKLSTRTLQTLRMALEGMSFDLSDEAILDPKKQPEEATKIFGYGKSYFGKILQSLANVNGHIFECERGEVNYKDVILNNKILLVAIPATEQEKNMRQTIGKIQLSGIRVAISTGLGPNTEGDVEDVIKNLPIDKKIPSLIIIDEYAEVAVPGFAVSATQGRGLGMAIVFAGQDLAGFSRASEEETDMIFGNTRLKVVMASEDPNQTLEYFKKIAGEEKVARSDGFDKTSGFSDHASKGSVSIQNEERLNVLDLKSFIEGEGLVFYRDEITPINLFVSELSETDAETMRINRQLQIHPPRGDLLRQCKQQVEFNTFLKVCGIDWTPPKTEQNTLIRTADNDNLDTDWIYKLLEVEPNSDFSQTSDSSTDISDEVSKLDQHSVEQSLTPESNIEPPPQSVAMEQTQDNAPSDDTVHPWLYSFETSSEALSGAQVITEALTKLGAALTSEEKAAETAQGHVSALVEQYQYTQQPQIEPNDDDEELLWAETGILEGDE